MLRLLASLSPPYPPNSPVAPSLIVQVSLGHQSALFLSTPNCAAQCGQLRPRHAKHSQEIRDRVIRVFFFLRVAPCGSVSLRGPLRDGSNEAVKAVSRSSLCSTALFHHGSVGKGEVPPNPGAK
ncbi:hypothetical protein AGIG_G5450 [Arapaima gigas]